MLFITSPYDPISMHSAIEPQTLSSHVLAAFRRNNNNTDDENHQRYHHGRGNGNGYCNRGRYHAEFSTEAGSKYSVSGALPSGPSPFGEPIIYGSTGITNPEELVRLFVPHKQGSASASELYVQTAGLNFISIAFPSKISAVPFHM
jgi:NADH:ubiquinone oxidoreductase subunit 2 (subunit N)